jgi:glycosyltransferase involved in cell wall biosynthesis
MIENSRGHEIVLALNGCFSESIGPIQNVVNALAPDVKVVIWNPPKNVSYELVDRAAARTAAEYVREAFLLSLKPSVILVTSLFEGCDDDSVTSVARLAASIPTAVILYDLIPLVNHKLYLDNGGVFSDWYYEKIRHLKRATKLLAISESSRHEAIRHLGFNREDVISISTAADAHFKVSDIQADEEARLREKYKLHRAFVMYTGGIERRKNIERLVVAYSKLPKELRLDHQLAIVCSASEYDRDRLLKLAVGHGLSVNDLILTGYVPEQDLVALYNLCKIFVFPSWHEGFGLPALEAMKCGRAVIAANTSSLPEVIGLDEALFDPLDEDAISFKICQVLQDEVLRERLQQHGLERSEIFSWERSAKAAIDAMEVIVASEVATPAVKKPRLAYVSPLPPERSGISDYSAELIPYLSQFYEIDVVVNQAHVSALAVNTNATVRTVQWFVSNQELFDRVLYHFGNSHFHEHMFSLVRSVPGVVVLHDFYLSNFIHFQHITNPGHLIIEKAMYKSHGYRAMRDCTLHGWSQEKVANYPCSFEVLASSLGVIVHSKNSVRLAKEWYSLSADDWGVIPLLRIPSGTTSDVKAAARKRLGLSDSDFLVCSFGYLAPTKLSLELYEAWQASSLSDDAKCVLVFVGDTPKNEYGSNLRALVKGHDSASRVEITGWADEELYRDYLAAADVGVQLRTMSRGETSAAVLDCMNYGLATIVNSNGSMAELDEAVVYKLVDEFTQDDLVRALTHLRLNPGQVAMLGAAACDYISSHHNPTKCAAEYYDAIEAFYECNDFTPSNIVKAVMSDVQLSDFECMEFAGLIDSNVAPLYRQKQWLVDVSSLINDPVSGGGNNDKLAFVEGLLLEPPMGYRVEPIYFSESSLGYKYARDFTLGLLEVASSITNEELVRFRTDDVFVSFEGEVVCEHRTKVVNGLRQAGFELRIVTTDGIILSGNLGVD